MTLRRGSLAPGAARVCAAGVLAWPAVGGAQVAATDSADALAARADSVSRRHTPADVGRGLALWADVAARYARAGRPARVGYAFSRMGIAYRDAGRPDSALAYHRRALGVRGAAGDLAGVSASLMNIGLVHADVGRLDSALADYGQALRVARGAGQRANQAYALTNLGTAYATLGRPDSALAYYRQALPLWRQLGDREQEAGALANIGEATRHVGRPDSALAYYYRALAIWLETGNRFGLALTLNNVGTVHRGAGRPDSALAYYGRALPVWRELGTPRAAATLRNVGDVLRESGRADSALAYYGQALDTQRGAGDRIGEAGTLEAIATLYLRARPAGRHDPARAAAYFDSAAAAYAAIRHDAGGDANAISTAEAQQDAFAGWARAWLARVGQVGAEAGAGAALAAAERGRAQALLALLRGSAGRAAPSCPGAGCPAGADRPGADLRAEGDALLAPLRRRRAAALSYLVTRDTLVVWLLSAGGQLRASRVPVSRDTLGTLVRALRLGLEAGDGRQRRGTPSLTRARAALAALDDASTAGATTEAAAGAAAGAAGARPRAAGATAYASALRHLSRLLVPAELRPYLPAGGELIVVPHAALTAVPFAVLAPDGPGVPFGVRYALRYAPSLATLAVAGDDQRARAPLTGALVVGDPTMPPLPPAGPGRGGLDPLPGAAREARWVAARLGAPVLTGPAATESAVRARLSAAPVVHLATHGIVFTSAGRARDSFVALAPTAASDGLLTAGELLDDPAIRLTADLVVLSACQTGLGALAAGEGVVGLQRAFLARGARSLLVSLWGVSDQATALLMRRFYTHWLGDRDRPSKPEALRRAQGDVRATPAYAHPRYWAAFQLVGAR